MDTQFQASKTRFSSDHRGIVLEPLRPEEFAAQQNAHLVLTAPGCIRGNHYHEYGTEVTVVLGPALVRVRDSGVVRDYHIPAGEAYRFTFPPGLPHAMKNTGDAEMVTISFNTTVHDPAQPDVVREELITAS
jgi:UDP-2-acetamido-2,6-beta-L-arabino-hexul-4-ose reductase